jgi:RNA polymerase sigma-70 factor (ECF subfamily)
LTEKELIENLKQGREFAFSQCIKEYTDMVYGLCFRFLRNQNESEDCTQEVFIELYRSINGFKGESSLKTWIYTIAVRKSTDRIRKQNRAKRFGRMLELTGLITKGLEPESYEMDPAAQSENEELSKILQEALQKIPENQRIAFTLQQIDNLSQKDIASILNVSEGAVESLLQRAKKNLKTYLSEYYERHMK